MRPKSCPRLAGGRVCCWILQVSGLCGLLLTSAGVPRLVNIVPVLWAVIGGSAAFVLGIRAYLSLVMGCCAAQPNKRLQPSAPGATMSRYG